MKLRHGFVSNSSSSSFVLDKTKCSEEQLAAIRDHVTYADENFFDFYTDRFARWDLTEKASEIRGFTWMDNFDMKEFMRKIGVPGNAVSFDGEN